MVKINAARSLCLGLILAASSTNGEISTFPLWAFSSKADREGSSVTIGTIFAKQVSGEFLGHIVSHDCLLCELFAPSQGTEAL